MKQILCFGDSNTYGYIPDKTGRYDEKTRWTGILNDKFLGKGYRVIEEGLCGRTTVFDDPLREGRRGSQLLPILLETHKPVDTVVLMLGTNDCKRIYDASAGVIGKGIERLLQQIRTSDEHIKVLLVSPIALAEGVGDEGFDPEFDEKSVETSLRLPKVYEEIAHRWNAFYLPASKYAKASETDREHLDEKGHENLAGAIFHKLEEILY